MNKTCISYDYVLNKTTTLSPFSLDLQKWPWHLNKKKYRAGMKFCLIIPTDCCLWYEQVCAHFFLISTYHNHGHAPELSPDKCRNFFLYSLLHCLSPRMLLCNCDVMLLLYDFICDYVFFTFMQWVPLFTLIRGVVHRWKNKEHYKMHRKRNQ